jgi:NAD(P)-dependent dehydrogenase (short-subunit alcohol dehydrogenase family)
MTLRFDGKVAVVTGAGRGVGKAEALLFARLGASVVVNDLGVSIDGSSAAGGVVEDVVAEIKKLGGRAVANTSSVATEAGAAAIVASAIDNFGRLDVVVNNAGIIRLAPFSETSLDDFQAHLTVHVLGTFLVCKAAWPHLASTRGSIVNTTSSGIYGAPTTGAYSAAKGAVMAMTKTMAMEGAEAGIKVNALMPGAASRMTDLAGAPESKANLTLVPPESVAAVVGYLAHESCSFTGETITAKGGHVGRSVLAETLGYTRQNVDIDNVAENVERVMDLHGLRVLRNTSEQIGLWMERMTLAGAITRVP